MRPTRCCTSSGSQPFPAAVVSVSAMSGSSLSFDFAHCVQDGGVVAVAEMAPDLRQAHAGLAAAPHGEHTDLGDGAGALRAEQLVAHNAVLEAGLVDDAGAWVRG